MKFAVKHLAAVAALVVAGGASANDYPFAMPLSPQLPFSAAVPVLGVGAFSDRWLFTAPMAAATVSGASISVDLIPFFNIDNLTLSLFTSGDVLVATGPTGNGSSLEDILVTGGASYYFKVEGTVTSAPNGFYTFTAVSAPIPEPETYALMLGGLGVVGFMAARRRRQG